MCEDLSVFSKKFEDPYDLLLAYKAFCPSTFIYPQPGSTNDVDNSATSGNTAHNNGTERKNQDTLERLIEIIGAL